MRIKIKKCNGDEILCDVLSYEFGISKNGNSIRIQMHCGEDILIKYVDCIEILENESKV